MTNLPPHPSPLPQGARERTRAAFTLAEVLITLGIIGVVAAMTIPTLMTNYQKKQTVTRLKAAYSILNQAVRLAENENEDITGWDFSQDDWFGRYLGPHIKYSKSDYDNSTQYKELSGKRENGLWLLRQPEGIVALYTLLNGVDLITAYNDPTAVSSQNIIIDINGIHSLPNQFGKDLFIFNLDLTNEKKHKIYPFGMYSSSECSVPTDGNPSREFLKTNDCREYACNKESRGIWCAALIMKDGWTIAKDYPWN